MNQKNQKYLKALILALLSIPLFLMLSYIDSQNGFYFIQKLTNNNKAITNKDWLNGDNQQERFDIDILISALQKTIQEQKIKGSSKDVQKCGKFVGQGSMVLEDLHIPTQICEQNAKQMSHKIYFTILLKNALPVTLFKQINQTLNKIRESLKIEISSKIEILEESILPQYLGNKLYDRNYMQDIGEQIGNTIFGKQCRFQWKQCHNNILIVDKINNQNSEKGWFQVGEVVFVSQEYLLQAIVSLFSKNMPNITITSQLNRLQQLYSIHKKLLMIQKLPFPTQICSDGLQSYLRQVHNFISHKGTVPTDILWNRQVIKVDIMASEYKLGIFLPLFLILIIFPCWNVLKI